MDARQQDRRHAVRAQLPPGWRTGDKTGAGERGTNNDVGVLWPPEGRPIVVSVYLTGTSAPVDKRNATLAAVGRAVAAGGSRRGGTVLAILRPDAGNLPYPPRHVPCKLGRDSGERQDRADAILVIYAHPVETSFHAAMHARAVAALRGAGHEVDDCDLYAEGFNPVLSRQERLNYRRHRYQPVAGEGLCRAAATRGRAGVLLSGLVLRPPGDPEGLVRPRADAGRFLRHQRSCPCEACADAPQRIVALTSYGRPRWMAFVMGDPPRKVIKRYLRALTGGKARIDYHARYHMNVATPAGLERHMQRIESLMAKI